MKYNKLVILVICAVMSSACSGNVKRSLGISNDAPDEFMVLEHPPLTVPPDFRELPAPAAGAMTVNRNSQRDKAQRALFGGEKRQTSHNVTASERSLLGKTGIATDRNIRTKLAEDNKVASNEQPKKRSLFDKIVDPILGRKDPIVDADKEKERIAANKEAGKPVNEGEVPVIKRQDSVLGQIVD